MGKYIAKRLGYMVVVALILSLLMFLVYTMIPYDRAVVEVDSYKASLKNNPNAGELYEKKLAEKRHELGTDQNVFIRYLGWVGVAPINGKYQGILQGDFGWSYKYSRPAYDVLKAPMKNTIFINIFATILGLGITIPLGIFCAVHRGSKRDTAVQVGTIVGYSIPVFITSIVFIWLFAIILGWFPVSGMKTPGSDYTGMKKFLDELRSVAQVVILSDTFDQFAMPLMKKLGYPTLLCNTLEIDADGYISRHVMRCEHSKLTTVRALQSMGYDTIASGDSYNDMEMILHSKYGFLFRTTDKIKAEYPQLPAFEHYDDLLAAIKAVL